MKTGRGVRELKQIYHYFDLGLYRVAILLALTGLLASAASFAFPKLPAGFLCFFFPLCWFLWIACAFVRINNVFRLIALWIVIDLSILVMFLSVTASLGDVRHSQGTELVWLISYLPVIIPTGFWLHSLAHGIGIVGKPAEAWFGSMVGGVIADWTQFSILAVVQSIVIVSFAQLIWRAYRAFKRTPDHIQTETNY